MPRTADVRPEGGAGRSGNTVLLCLVMTLMATAAFAAGDALATPAGAAAAQARLPNTSARQALAPYAPEWSRLPAQDGNATADLGPAVSSAPVSAEVYLAGRDPAGLMAYAAAVSDPRSRLFHRYLTQGQVQARFGPAARQVADVESWVTAAGMRVTDVTAHYVTVSGTAAEAQLAFGTVWHSYQVDDTTQQSPPPGAELTAPASVASAVLTVAPVQTGLPGYMLTAQNETLPRAPANSAASTAASVSSTAAGGTPCSSYYGQNRATGLPPAYGRVAPYWGCGYTPQQMRSAYDVPANLTGTGVTVAVVDPWRQQTAAQDLARFAAAHGQPLRPGQFTQILPAGLDASCAGTTPGPVVPPQIETPEAEAVHEMAPGADIVYVGAKCDDGDATVQDLDALATVTDHDLASIVVCPWNVTASQANVSAGLVASYEQIFQQGAAEGIGFYFGFRDYFNTPSGSPGPTVEYPVSDPWVTSVGGTSLAIGPGGRYEWETGWGNTDTTLAAGGTSWASLPGTFFDGSGDGPSTLFRQPFYQRGIVPARLSRANGSAAAMRVTPDIAAAGDDLTTRLLFGQTSSTSPGGPAVYHEFTAGGTSIACALIAGIQADAQQAARTPIGFANPALYARYGTAAYHDVTDHPLGPGSHEAVVVPAGALGSTPLLVTLGTDQGLNATPGYDDITGVGTPGPGYFTSYRSRPVWPALGGSSEPLP
jgi:subtilase family serine protease